MKGGFWWHHDAIVIPNVVFGESNLGSLREDILHEHRIVLYSGHMDIFKMLKKIQIFFWWPKMKTNIFKYVNFCDVC